MQRSQKLGTALKPLMTKTPDFEMQFRGEASEPDTRRGAGALHVASAGNRRLSPRANVAGCGLCI